MTPPQNALEAAEALLQTDFRHPDADHRKKRTVLEALVGELKAARAERDRLFAERGPFKALFDEAFSRGEPLVEVSKRTLELARMLGFREPVVPSLIFDATGEKETTVTVRVGSRDMAFDVRVTTVDTMMDALDVSNFDAGPMEWIAGPRAEMMRVRIVLEGRRSKRQAEAAPRPARTGTPGPGKRVSR